MQRQSGSNGDLVEFRAARGETSIAVLMNRSLAEVQRNALEAEGWSVEISEGDRLRSA